MKKSRFKEEQIIQILKEGEASGKIGELCRRHNISTGTYYNWRSKYGGLELSELRKLKCLEEENGKLKKLLADAQLDILAMKDLLEKKW